MIGLPYPMTLVAKDETGSTNDDAKALADAGADDLTVVWALRQTRGRGRFGRKWHSNDGNLLWSVILRMPRGSFRMSEVPFVSALAARDAIAGFLPAAATVSVKWPNDVLIDDRKVSGTLVEASSDKDWIVVGVGINLAEAPDVALTLHDATSMAAEGATCSLEELCLRFSTSFLDRIEAWRAHGVTEAFLGDYRRNLWRVDQEICIALNADRSETLNGVNRSVLADFSLRVELPDGTFRNIYAGDVLFPAKG